jgi:hypothetical protein
MCPERCKYSRQRAGQAEKGAGHWANPVETYGLYELDK